MVYLEQREMTEWARGERWGIDNGSILTSEPLPNSLLLSFFSKLLLIFLVFFIIDFQDDDQNVEFWCLWLIDTISDSPRQMPSSSFSIILFSLLPSMFQNNFHRLIVSGYQWTEKDRKTLTEISPLFFYFESENCFWQLRVPTRFVCFVPSFFLAHLYLFCAKFLNIY